MWFLYGGKLALIIGNQFASLRLAGISNGPGVAANGFSRAALNDRGKLTCNSEHELIQIYSSSFPAGFDLSTGEEGLRG